MQSLENPPRFPAMNLFSLRDRRCRPSPMPVRTDARQNRCRMPRLTMLCVSVPPYPYEPIDACARCVPPSRVRCVPVARCHAQTRYRSVRLGRT
ncbi:hypothetical protein X946_5478 [Burkholderia sp. ABCPW 111]|nr:hypothetical protein X946_5478 [Burkholderia sp. ABCPW 111]